MKKVQWSLSTGFAGCEYNGTIEVDDNATEEEIDELVKEEAFNNIDWGWSEVKQEAYLVSKWTHHFISGCYVLPLLLNLVLSDVGFYPSNLVI